MRIIRKIGKYALTLLLVCIVTVSAGAVVQAEEAELSENGYTYCVYDGVAQITGYTGTEADLVLPDTLGGYPVNGVAYCAFESNTGLRSVTLPEGYIFVDNGAFDGCSSLAEVSLPSTLRSIGDRAFRDCTSLKDIDFPDHLISIQDEAFLNTGLVSVTLPDSLQKSDSYYTVIGEAALGYYNDPDTGDYAKVSGFNINGSENSEAYFYALSNGFLFNGQSMEGYIWNVNEDGKSVTVTGYYGSEKNLVIPSELGGYPVTAIGSYEFMENSDIESIVFPDTLTEIQNYAFWGCSSLKSVTIPEGVEYIGSCAFVNTKLTEVSLPDGLISLDDYAFGYSFPGTVEDCFFDDGDDLDAMVADHDFNIIASAGTEAERYAKENNFTFISTSAKKNSGSTSSSKKSGESADSEKSSETQVTSAKTGDSGMLFLYGGLMLVFVVGAVWGLAQHSRG